MFYIGKLCPKAQTLTLEYVNLYQNGTPFIQWNSDFLNTRLFETPDSFTGRRGVMFDRNASYIHRANRSCNSKQ